MTETARRAPLADPAEAGIDAEALDALLTRCRREIDEGILPSCQMAVAAGDRLVAFEAFGEADRDSRYVVFSCTKAIVAGAFFLLLGDGVVSLDQKVSEIVPEFGTNGKDAVTVRQLLLHEGGFPRARLDLEADLGPDARRASFAEWRLDWEPGSRYEYHPVSAHWVIAELIERLSGTDYRSFVHGLLDSLGLFRFRLGVPLSEQNDVKDLEVRGTPPSDAELAEGLGIPGVTLEEYLGDVTDAALLRFNRPAARAAGVPGAGGISDAADLALYYQALLHNPAGRWDPAVLEAGTLEIHGQLPDRWTRQPSNRALGVEVAGDPPASALRGFGYTVSPRTFGHGGAGGQIAFADPDTDISFSYLTNGLDADVLRQGRRTASIASRVGQLKKRPAQLS
jgi:CubicO group peptidase (beta-lactamase class C family)